MNASAMCGEQENRLERMRQRMKAKKKKRASVREEKRKIKSNKRKSPSSSPIYFFHTDMKLILRVCPVWHMFLL